MVLASHSAVLPGGTFGLCGEVSALYLETLNVILNEEAICCHGDRNHAAFTRKRPSSGVNRGLKFGSFL